MVTSPNWGILDGSVDIVGQYLLIAVDSAIDSQELNVIFKSVEILGESLDLCVVRIIGTLEGVQTFPEYRSYRARTALLLPHRGKAKQ